MLIIVLVARTAVTYALSGLFKLCLKHKWILTAKELSIITLGGAIRGAVAFALILSVEGKHHRVIITTTLGLVVITTILFGAIMPLWVWIFAEPKDPKLNPIKIDFRTADEKKTSLITHPNHNFRIKAQDSKKKRGFLHRKFREFDDKYLKPCLMRADALQE